MKFQVFLNENFRDSVVFGFDPASDMLREAVSFEQEPSGDIQADLEKVFDYLNIGGDPGFNLSHNEYSQRYREEQNRSLSKGDVIIAGDQAYAVASYGFKEVGMPGVEIAIKRYNRRLRNAIGGLLDEMEKMS